MAEDFSCLYISNEISSSVKIKNDEIYNQLINHLEQKGVKVSTIIETKGNIPIKKHYINIKNEGTLWELALNTINFDNFRKLYLSLRPKTDIKTRHLNIPDTERIATEDIKMIKDKIGIQININVNNFNTSLNAFSYSDENFIDISNWQIILGNFSIKYKDFLVEDNVNLLEQEIKDQIKKMVKFRLINATMNSPNFEYIKNLIKNIGEIIDPIYNINNYRQIRDMNDNSNIMNIIILRSEDKEVYKNTKLFFIQNNLPFQHVKVDSNIIKYESAYKIFLFEIYKKLFPDQFYLLPDHFLQQEKNISGFIYLDINPKINERNTISVSYVFTKNNDYIQESINTLNVNFHKENNKIIIEDPENLSELIISGNSGLSAYKNTNYYFNILITKQFDRESISKLINNLLDNNIKINKVYYISNYKMRFADNYNYFNNNNFIHRYKIIGKNNAVIKLSTKKFLFPQLFSTYVEIKYPYNSEISETDIKNIIWLAKKRLYRVHSLYNITQLEPIKIKQHNKYFINEYTTPIKLNYLI